ncbi:MAG: GGDEF domain-containing protein [Pseudonocardiales bacterium]|nr:GGDEF domain-containing protein [Pseudonocardiales bacterium]
MSRSRGNPFEGRARHIRALPSRVVTFLVGVEVLAVAAVLVAVATSPPTVLANTLASGIGLLVAAVLHTEASLGVERTRHRMEATPHADLSSVWTFAGALILPPLEAVALVLLIYLHLYLRAWRPLAVPPHRVIFSTATVVLAALAAGAIVGPTGPAPTAGGLALALLALAVYGLLNLVLVVVAIRLSSPGTTLAGAVGHRDELLLELATLAMGAVMAGVVAALGPFHVVLALPPLVVLHRTVLVRQLAAAATTDAKTGLLTAAEWRMQASLALRRARHEDRAAAVVLLDLDHFKVVNDRHGHLAGDQVLAAVGEALRGEVREVDVVGRFGGEEFVVLLADIAGDDPDEGALHVADRIRRRIAALRPEIDDGTARVTISAGVATLPRDGADLERLLEVADAALYAAKDSGRNAVRARPDEPPPAPGLPLVDLDPGMLRAREA